MTPTKIMILPYGGNRELVRALQRGYIAEEFGHLTQTVAQFIHNPSAAMDPAFGHTLFTAVNCVILDNLMRYVINNETMSFASVMMARQFAPNCSVRIKYLDGIFHQWSTLQGDRDWEENAVSDQILHWMGNHFHFHHDELHQCLMKLYEEFLIYTPYRYVRNYRFEISPELRAVFIYSDVVHEVHSLQ